ncbi:MAG: TRAP transporter small permease [Dehalococcoidia bacterium]
MMMITVVDAIGRKFFSFPVPGSYETGTFLLSIVFFFSLAYCTVMRGHFVIDIVTSRLSPHARLPIVTMMYLLSALVSWVVAFQLVVLAIDLKADHVTGTQLTFLPVYPFALAGTLCLIITGLWFLVQSAMFLVKTIERNG